MPRLGHKTADRIRYLGRCGFTGPKAGGSREDMVRGSVTPRNSKPAPGDISKGLLVRILRQAGIDRNEWEKL